MTKRKRKEICQMMAEDKETKVGMQVQTVVGKHTYVKIAPHGLGPNGRNQKDGVSMVHDHNAL